MRRAIPVQDDGSILLPRDLAEEVFGKAKDVVVHVRSGCIVLSPIYVDMDSGALPDLLKAYHEWEMLDTVLSRSFHRTETEGVQFEGELSVLALSDVFLFLSASKKTGVLILEAEKKRGFFFNNGEIVYAASQDPKSGLAACLLRRRFLTEQDLAQGMDRLREAEDQAAVLRGVSGLSKQEFTDQWLRCVETMVFKVFTLDEGHFSFQNGSLDPHLTLKLPMTTTNYVMEATRRVDEWARLKDRIPSPDTVLKVAEEVTASTKLSYEEEQVLANITGDRTFEEVMVRSKVGEMEGKKAVASLIAAGMVLALKKKDEPSTSSPVEAGVIGDEERGGLESRIERYNNVFSTIYQALSLEAGAKVEVILNAFFKGLEPGGSILVDMGFTEEGTLEPGRLMEALSRREGDKESILAKDLNELLYFQLFAVKNTLGEEMEAGIVEMAKSLLQD